MSLVGERSDGIGLSVGGDPWRLGPFRVMNAEFVTRDEWRIIVSRILVSMESFLGALHRGTCEQDERSREDRFHYICGHTEFRDCDERGDYGNAVVDRKLNASYMIQLKSEGLSST